MLEGFDASASSPPPLLSSSSYFDNLPFGTQMRFQVPKEIATFSFVLQICFLGELELRTRGWLILSSVPNTSPGIYRSVFGTKRHAMPSCFIRAFCSPALKKPNSFSRAKTKETRRLATDTQVADLRRKLWRGRPCSRTVRRQDGSHSVA